MTENESRELASLRDEIRALREEVRQLRALLPAAQVHYHPEQQWYASCAAAGVSGLGTYTVNAPLNTVPIPLNVDTSVAAGCAPVQIWGMLP